MTREEYQKLNDYLNGCFKLLEVHDKNLLDNIYGLSLLSDKYIKMTQKYEWSDIRIKTNSLTFEEVYLLAREIINDINPNYVKDYDTLIENGILDFGYDDEYFDSHYEYNSKTGNEQININREFTYLDVIVLVHEYIHKTNQNKKTSVNREILTEFFSIYFQTYAKNYLIPKGISKEELFYDRRLLYTMGVSDNFSWYSIILLSYSNFGNIDEETYKLLNEYFLGISKEDFDEECSRLLNKFEQNEKQYRMNILYEREFNEDELYKGLVKLLNIDYQYILGTVLAFYARENCDKEKIVYLNDHINNEYYANLSLIDILKTIDIDLDAIGVHKLIAIIEDKLIELGYKEKKQLEKVK